MELGHKLKSLRKKSGYSQQQLAEQLNVTPQVISKKALFINAKQLFKDFPVALF